MSSRLTSGKLLLIADARGARRSDLTGAVRRYKLARVHVDPRAEREPVEAERKPV